MRLARWLLASCWLAAAATAATPRAARCAAPGPGPGNFYDRRGFTHDIVTVACDDDYHLAADYVRRAKFPRRMPGVIFLHAAGGDRHAWFPITLQTAGRGCAVLAVDLRGHGENPGQVGNPALKAADLSASDYGKMLSDVRNLVSYLAMRNEVDGGHLAIVGAGLGANLALLAAGQSWAAAVTCVIAASPTLDDHGVAPLPALAHLDRTKAVYLAAGLTDAASAAACDAILPLLKGPHEYYRPDGEPAGATMIGRGLFNKVPQWLLDGLIRPATADAGPDTPAGRRR